MTTKNLTGLGLCLAMLCGIAGCKKSYETAASSQTGAPNTAASTSAQASPQVAGAWQRVLTDDFTNAASLNDWQKTNRADYNSSICHYQPANISFGNYDSRDVMVLTANKNGSIYNSGHVKSNFSFKPGTNEEYRVSSQIKLIAIDGGGVYKDFTQTYGAWPAFWTIQETNWPTEGEIDIMEGYSFTTYARFASNLFYGTSVGNNQLGNTCEKQYSVDNSNASWHMYDEYWKNQNGVVTVTIKLDGNTVSTYTNSINGNLHLENFGPHNIIFNLNVGSNSNVGIFDNSKINLFAKTMMWVDYVTVDKRTI